MDKEWIEKQLYLCTKDYTTILNKNELYLKDSKGVMIADSEARADLKEEIIEEYFTPISEAFENDKISVPYILTELYLLAKTMYDRYNREQLHSIIKNIIVSTRKH